MHRYFSLFVVVFSLFCFSFSHAEKRKSYFLEELKDMGVGQKTTCLDLDGKCYGERVPEYDGKRAPSSFPSVAQRRGLDRFYFLRHCDTPETLAQTIYGDPAKARELKSWNANSTWEVGEVIFFRSPVPNADPNLKNLFDEHPGRTEYYIVQRNDNLQKIAQTYLGDYRSWKDIAYLNNLRQPDEIEVGQKLLLRYLR